MATQSWLEANRSSGPLRLALRAAVVHPLLQCAALCGLTAHAPPRAAIEAALELDRMHSADTRARAVTPL